MDIETIKEEILSDNSIKDKISVMNDYFWHVKSLACIIQPYFGKKTDDELSKIVLKLMEHVNSIEEAFIREYCLAEHAMRTVIKYDEKYIEHEVKMFDPKTEDNWLF